MGQTAVNKCEVGPMNFGCFSLNEIYQELTYRVAFCNHGTDLLES